MLPSTLADPAVNGYLFFFQLGAPDTSQCEARYIALSSAVC